MKLLLCNVIVLSCALGAWSLTATELSIIAQYADNVTTTINNRKDTYRFISKALPHYASSKYVDIVHSLTDYRLTVNQDPTPAATPRCLHSGPIAMAANGVPIFRPYTSLGRDANVVEYTSFDECKGHTSPQGRYHYHGIPSCMVDSNEVDQFIGVAEDGYPIYGPFDLNGEVTKADLDDCQGRLETVGNEQVYRYRMTNEFPYSLGCFYGELYNADPAPALGRACLFVNDCGPNPGLIAASAPLYTECGGGEWTGVGGNKKRAMIEAKLEALQEMETAVKKDLQEDVEDEGKAEDQAMITGKRAHSADVAEMRRGLAQSRALKARQMAGVAANVKSSTARQMASDDGDHSNEDERDLTGEVLRGLKKVLEELKDE